jgi:enoyl-CoA hydratase
MREQYETLALSEPAGQVLQVTLNRPNVANAMNTQMGLDLLDVFTDLFARPDAYRAVVVTGAGERAFCAGGDLKERQGMSDETWQAQHLIFERMIRAVLEAPMPVIAAVNGAAYAGGCEISLGCDFIYAARTARFALTEVTIGIMPGAGGTQTLTRLIGKPLAKELMWTGRRLTAAEAREYRLVNHVTPKGQALAKAREILAEIGKNAPLAVMLIKQAVDRGVDMSLADGLATESDISYLLTFSEDREEGLKAFREKRPPKFRGQ